MRCYTFIEVVSHTPTSWSTQRISRNPPEPSNVLCCSVSHLIWYTSFCTSSWSMCVGLILHVKFFIQSFFSSFRLTSHSESHGILLVLYGRATLGLWAFVFVQVVVYRWWIHTRKLREPSRSLFEDFYPVNTCIKKLCLFLKSLKLPQTWQSQ